MYGAMQKGATQKGAMVTRQIAEIGFNVLSLEYSDAYNNKTKILRVFVNCFRNSSNKATILHAKSFEKENSRKWFCHFSPCNDDVQAEQQATLSQQTTPYNQRPISDPQPAQRGSIEPIPQSSSTDIGDHTFSMYLQNVGGIRSQIASVRAAITM